MQMTFVGINIGSTQAIIKFVNIAQIESVEPKYPDKRESMAIVTMSSGRLLVTGSTTGEVLDLIRRAKEADHNEFDIPNR